MNFLEKKFDRKKKFDREVWLNDRNWREGNEYRWIKETKCLATFISLI